jgi:hypothetical protein
MPHLTFPLGPDGPTLAVVIGLTGREMASLVSVGQPIPAPLTLRGYLDTGTDASCIAPWAVQQLGLARLGSVSTHTAGGQVKARLFDVSLTISGPAGKAGPFLVRDHLTVMELAHPLPNLDALVGRDVLAECLLIIDGPGKQFTLAF